MVEKLRRSVIKSFMDIFIFSRAKEGPHERLRRHKVHSRQVWDVAESGTVYSLLYSMEREGLINGVQNSRKRVYTLTEKGKQNIRVITKANDEIQSFLRNMSSLKE